MEPEKKTNILLVDDNEAKLLALESALSELNQNLVKATSGREALRALLTQDFAVILLDVRMPEMDGFETATLIRQRQKSAHTPIIFVTAFERGETPEVRGYSLGAVDYIYAPIVPEILRAKVGVFVELMKRTEELREAEERLRASVAELARSNAELGQFAYVVSHDLQEPLRMVAGYVQLLADRYQERLDSDANDFISYAVDGAARMKNMINDLLVYSRLGRPGQESAPIACEAVLKEVCANLQAAITESSASITHDPLPTVAANASQLPHLFQNLIGNAIKFRSQEAPRIHVSAKLNGKKWVFSVRDNGIGLEQQDAERIFMVFQRLHSREEYPGTGIGLAIAKKIVEQHGGRIWVESEPGQGATFYFTIPARVPDGKV